MGAVSQIAGKIKDEMVVLIPDHKEIPFLYSMEENDSQLDKVFGIRIGSASNTSGANRHMTFNQDFIIDLTRKHVPKKGNGDKDLREKIFLLHDDIQKLYKNFSMRSFSVPDANVLLISPVDISQPTTENGIVTVSLTLQVQYRVSI